MHYVCGDAGVSRPTVLLVAKTHITYKYVQHVILDNRQLGNWCMYLLYFYYFLERNFYFKKFAGK